MKNQILFAITLLTLLCMFAPGYAQSPQPRQRAEIEAREKEQRRRDEETIRNMADPGADISFVVASRANIREEPYRTSTIVKEVVRGEVLSLVERQTTGTWYHVIHIESAVEGWIEQSSVINKLTANRYNAPRFQEEVSSVYEDPKLEITNRELSTDLNLRINGTLYVIKANTKQTIRLPPGHYEYYGWSPGVRPAIGNQDLAKGYKYSWTFFIRRV